ncbi:MAG TPA: hypothetical protein VFM37_14985 [Pseudonocardiaceae bacterium]|nr:hypothetical protein [Pseudonocardiaceae bacterium]
MTEPHIVAIEDQINAELRNLVTAARAHRAICVSSCVGMDVVGTLLHRTAGQRLRLLVYAVARLADHDTPPAAPPPVAEPAEAPTSGSHQAVADAISAYLTDQPEGPLRAALAGLLTLHVAEPAETTGKPDPSCGTCHGLGLYSTGPDHDPSVHHCCCGCAWCGGCETSLCTGPCDTLAEIADALGLHTPPEGAPA